LPFPKYKLKKKKIDVAARFRFTQNFTTTTLTFYKIIQIVGKAKCRLSSISWSDRDDKDDNDIILMREFR